MRLDEISQFKREEIAHELRHEDEMMRREQEARRAERRRPRRRTSMVRQYLNVPYAEKDEAKRLGARWDPQEKKWYMEVFAGTQWHDPRYEHWLK